jgi:hypothetical protein
MTIKISDQIAEKNKRIEFGDFQTPDALAYKVCAHLSAIGFNPDVVIEPTCGIGSFVIAAAETFTKARYILGFEINPAHLKTLRSRLKDHPEIARIRLKQMNFFDTDWKTNARMLNGRLLILGNFPWVINSKQAVISANQPEKSNLQGFNGSDTINDKSSFDISEWMLLDALHWLSPRGGDVAMLVKTTVARKVLAHTRHQAHPVAHAQIIGIDSKKHFNVSVPACLLIISLHLDRPVSRDYTVFENFEDSKGRKIGHRRGLAINDLDTFESCSFLLGASPQKWRSGVKHDASPIMELTRSDKGYKNGLRETIELEDLYLFPLLKGSDIGGNKGWHDRFVLVTQHTTGEDTSVIERRAPKTWTYLIEHADKLDHRGSAIYSNTPRFAIFGIGDYAFKPWRIAICSLYKTLKFRLVPPIEGRPAMFDDTVYYLSFDTEEQAQKILEFLMSEKAIGLLSSLIFWDEKRPIKAGILNTLDWSRAEGFRQAPEAKNANMFLSRMRSSF